MKLNRKNLEKVDQSILTYARWILKWRWAVVVLTVLIAAIIGRGASGLFFDTNYRAFFSEHNPQLQAFEELQNIYTQNDNIMFVLAPKDKKVFTAANLSAVEKLTAESWKMPFAIRVDAVTNFQHTHAEDDDLIVEDLVEGPMEQPAGLLAQAQAVAINEPFLRRRLIDPEASVTGVNVTLQLTGDATELPQAVAYARQLADEIRTAYPNIEVYITGIAMLNNAFMEVSQNELKTLVPLMFLAMSLIMIFSLRSVSGTLATLMLLVLSVMIAMGTAGFFNIGLTPPSGQAPIIILTLAIADSIHILVTMLAEMRNGRRKYDAIVESIRVNFTPVFLTSISTIIGFLSLNFSDVPPFNHLGNITAVGVFAAFVLSVSFLPALAAILPIRVKIKQQEKSGLMDRLAAFVIDRRTVLLWGSAVVMMILITLIPLNRLDDRFVEIF